MILLKGVGAATAKLFASYKWNVVINCSKSMDAAKKVSDECVQQFGAKTLVIPGNVSKDADCKSIVDSTICEFGNLDVLVNNAATTKYAFDHSNLESLSSEDFLNIYATNVIGPYNLIKYSKAFLLKSPAPSVVNVASIAGIRGNGSSVAYAASKGALITMTLSLARALGPIKVNAICPGFIEGEWLKAGLGEERYERARKSLQTSVPLRRNCTPEDVARAIFFFASEQNVVTGQTLVLDGGAHLGK